MQTLAALLSDPRGADLLAGHGVFSAPEPFLAALRPAMGPKGASGSLPVYLHQQPAPDFGAGVVAKIAALIDLSQRSGGRVMPHLVAIDTDRAASSRGATRLVLDDDGPRPQVFPLTPPGSKYLEFRHIRTDPAQLAGVVGRLAAHLARHGTPAQQARLQCIAPHIAPEEAGKGAGVDYGRLAAGIGAFLIGAQFGTVPEISFSSALQDHPVARRALVGVLGGLDGFVAAVNDQIAAHHALGLGTAIGPLPPDYLPLFYSCPVTGERMRLHRRREGGVVMAEALSRHGRSYRFSLGRGDEIDALAATGRWSVDVMLPVLLADMFSGLVVGRSSALYGMVMQAGLRKAFGTSICPMLVPPALAGWQPGGAGLFQLWLRGEQP